MQKGVSLEPSADTPPRLRAQRKNAATQVGDAAVSRRNRVVIACVMMGRLQGNNGRVTKGRPPRTSTESMMLK